MNLRDSEDRVVASAQYVIGLLEDDEREQFEAQLLNDPALRAEVARWQDDLLGLNAQTAEVEPPGQLWNRIAQALPEPVARTSEAAARRTAGPGSWSSLRFWRFVSAAAVSVAVLMGAYIAQRPPEVRVYLAVLKSPDQRTGWLVKAGTAGTVTLIPLDTATTVPSGKSLQLWTKPAQASAPLPVALIDPGQTFEIPVAQLPGLAREQLFAISLEPEGGSPTGLPTGPILFAGNTEQL